MSPYPSEPGLGPSDSGWFWGAEICSLALGPEPDPEEPESEGFGVESPFASGFVSDATESVTLCPASGSAFASR